MLELIEYFKNNNIMTIRYGRIQRKLVFRTDRYLTSTDFVSQQSYLDKWNMVNSKYNKINEFINYA